MIVQTIGLSGELLKSLIDKMIKLFKYSDGGTVGIFTAIEQFNGTVAGILLGLFCLSIAICFGLSAGGTALLLTKVESFSS